MGTGGWCEASFRGDDQVIDATALRRSRHHLPPDTVRRMCCDANIIPIVLGGDGVPLDHGRNRRLATAEQRWALRAMYRTCGHPGCTVRFDDCRIHHVQWWEHPAPPTWPT